MFILTCPDCGREFSEIELTDCSQREDKSLRCHFCRHTFSEEEMIKQAQEKSVSLFIRGVFIA